MSVLPPSLTMPPPSILFTWLTATDPEGELLKHNGKPWWEWDGFIGAGNVPPWIDGFVPEGNELVVYSSESLKAMNQYAKLFWSADTEGERHTIAKRGGDYAQAIHDIKVWLTEAYRQWKVNAELDAVFNMNHYYEVIKWVEVPSPFSYTRGPR